MSDVHIFLPLKPAGLGHVCPLSQSFPNFPQRLEEDLDFLYSLKSGRLLELESHLCYSQVWSFGQTVSLCFSVPPVKWEGSWCVVGNWKMLVIILHGEVTLSV